MRRLRRPRGPLLLVVLGNLLVAAVIGVRLLDAGSETTDATADQRRPAPAATDPAGAAIAAAQRSFPSGPVRVVFIVTGASSRDAMIAGAAAALLGGPVLPVGEDGIPAEVRRELRRLDPRRIIVLGGPDAVSGETAAELASFTDGPVTRLAGTDRYETAAATATTLFTAPVPQVLVVVDTGADAALRVPDRVPRAVRPVLLVTSEGVPAPTMAALRTLRPRSIVLQGEPSEAVLQDLRDATAGPVTRLPAAR